MELNPNPTDLFLLLFKNGKMVRLLFRDRLQVVAYY
jgi:hypothetical protein